MKRISAKFFAISLTIFFTACASNNDEPAKIRLVDMEGKSHAVVMKTPDLNNQAIAAQQGVTQNPWDISKNPTSPGLPRDSDFGSASSQMIQQTFQSSPNQDGMNVAANSVSDSSSWNVKDNSENAIIAAGAVDEPQQAVEYDLSEQKSAAEKPAVRNKKVTKFKSTKSPSLKAAAKKGGKKFFAQLGSFANQTNANNLLAKMENFHSGKIEIVEGEKPIYRVLLGPFPNKAQANAMVKKVKDSGQEAILVRSK